MKIVTNRSNSKGATAVEFALLVPVFLFLVFGIIEFGRYFFVQHTIQFATREGTRLALVGTQLQDEEGEYMTREASIIETIKDNSSFAVNPDDLQISIYPVDPTTYEDPDEWETTVDAGEGGDYMRVRVRYIYNFITPFIKDFFQQGTNVIRAEALYRNEGF